MRYILQEPILKTVANDDVKSIDDIKHILQSVHRMQHFAEIVFLDNDAGSMRYNNVRVIDVKDDTIDIHVFQPTATMKIKNIAIDAIQKLRIVASKQEIAQKYKVTRWALMDVAEIVE